MAVQCENTSCPENNLPKDTANLEELYGRSDFEVTCGACGGLCVWLTGENTDPKEPTE